MGSNCIHLIPRRCYKESKGIFCTKMHGDRIRTIGHKEVVPQREFHSDTEENSSLWEKLDFGICC